MRIISVIKAVMLSTCLLVTTQGITAEKETSISINSGKKLAFARNKGNCLACHRIEEGEFPGNIGPELKNIKQRFKSQIQLRQFIWDATAFNSETIMPPFGKHKILTEDEIDRLINYLWTL
ncbi:MAG: sulfur oxidation c-type cytochrome SoxX [Methylococcales bacterium]|nr:sulfur oxidation c-type cytochrome SoxX [Methylococcales bacterium]